MSSFFRQFPELSSPAGSRHLLVPAIRVERWTESMAYAAFRDAMSERPSDAHDLIELAKEYGCRSRDLEVVARFLAAEVARGSLVPICVPDPFERGSSPGYPGQRRADSWDDLRPLSDLRDADVTVEWSWVSVEVLDHTGVPYAGLEITLVHGDGRRDRVVLDDLGRHTARAVPKDGRTTVYWPQKLEVASGTAARPALDGFQATPGDVAVPREPHGRPTSLGQMGRHYRLIVDGPPRHPTVSYPSSIFATESALPTHAIGDLTTRTQQIADSDRAARFGIFGHTDLRDDADANKALADRRAQAVFGLLTGDWDAFRSALEGEDLALSAHQMMLRALGCNPTAIDGESGSQTDLAVAAFRRAYNAGTWHTARRGRAYGDLPDGDNTLDDATKAALLDAYHAEHSGMVDAARFLGPRHAGCGEFNPLADGHVDNRRVTLAIYGSDAPDDGAFPCKRGDAGACEVDNGGKFTCRFYRERIHEERVEHELTPFWDFEWLKTLSGKAHLSALTHLPDSNDVEFTVRTVRLPADADDAGAGVPPTDGELVATLPGLIRSGVAYALWDHGEAHDPFKVTNWFRTVEATGTELRDFAPYRFTVAGSEKWGRSDAPGYRLRELSLSEPDGPLVALRTDGRLLLLDASDLPQVERGIRVAAVRRRGALTTGFQT